MAENKTFRLGDQARAGLVDAFTAAIEVHDRAQFNHWFHRHVATLLPHESAVCIMAEGPGGANRVECVIGAGVIENSWLWDAADGLAARLARTWSGGEEILVVNAEAVGTMAALAGGDVPLTLVNVVLHRSQLPAGENCCLVLLNVPPDECGHVQLMLKHLSKHMKLALSRVAQELGISPPPAAAAAITARELEILHWMEQGKSNQEISAILGVGHRTIRNHISKIYRKLDVHNREDAVDRYLSLAPLGRC